MPFSSTLGGATVTPSSVAQTTATDTGAFDVTFKATVDAYDGTVTPRASAGASRR